MARERGAVWIGYDTASATECYARRVELHRLTCRAVCDPLSSASGLPSCRDRLIVLVDQNISTVDNYWSSTTDPSDATNALRERFGLGSGGVITANKGSLARRWCVRGPDGRYGIP
jgi:hypothetical protein